MTRACERRNTTQATAAPLHSITANTKHACTATAKHAALLPRSTDIALPNRHSKTHAPEAAPQTAQGRRRRRRPLGPLHRPRLHRGPAHVVYLARGPGVRRGDRPRPLDVPGLPLARARGGPGRGALGARAGETLPTDRRVEPGRNLVAAGGPPRPLAGRGARRRRPRPRGRHVARAGRRNAAVVVHHERARTREPPGKRAVARRALRLVLAGRQFSRRGRARRGPRRLSIRGI